MAISVIKIQAPNFESFIKYSNYYDGFEKVAQTYKIEIMYKWVAEDGNTWMGYQYGGLFHVFEIPEQFPTIEEYHQAKQEGFQRSAYDQWNRLKKLGYKSEAEVDEDRGDYEIDQWIEIKSMGYNNCTEFDKERGTGIRDHEKPCRIDVDSFQFHVAIIDGTNISYGDYEEYPRFKFILSVYEKLKELGVKPYVVVSAALRHKIDEPAELVEFLKRDDVAEAPAKRPDDFFVIQLAFNKEAFIVSNDRFRDWKKANPDLAEEIESRRVALTFIEDEPQFDHKLYKLIKQPIKHNS